MNFSEQIVYAMFKPSKYKEIINLATKRFVSFTIVFMLVLGLVTFIVPAGAYIAGFGGFENLFKNKVSSIQYNDGVLSIEKPFEISIEGMNILIDSETATVPDEKLDRDGTYFAVGSQNMRVSVVYDREIMDYQTVSLSSILPEGFNNEMLIDFIPGIYMYLVIMFIITCVGFFIKYGFIALVFSILINSMNKRLELGLRYGQVFAICFYGQTLGMILVNFNAALNFLPAIIVSLVATFISINMITMSVAIMHQGKQL